MPTLTTSWQNLGSATLSTGITIYLDGKYSSQSVANNTSTIQFRLRSGGISWRTSNGTAKFTGAFTDSESCATYPSYIDDGDTITSISKTVTHNTDGTKSLSIGGQIIAILGGSSRTANISNTTVSLPKIDRVATMLSATDFTDEGNPTITFNNPSNFSVQPYLNFYDNSGNLVYDLTLNSYVTSPYTWNISSADRALIRSATNQQSSYRVNVGISTYNNGTYIGSSANAKTMTYVNATPSQVVTLEETNPKVISVLGNDSSATYIIQNASKLHFACTPTVLKSATVNNVSLYQNNALQQAITTSPYSFNDVLVTSNKFNVITTDSRALTANQAYEYTSTYIEYLPVDITAFSFVRQAPTSANIILNAEITYKQTSFNGTANVPTIKWKVGESGALNTISSNDYTIDTVNNKIIISNLTLTNALAYNLSDDFYLYASDLLTEDTDYTTVTKGIPTFEAGEHDFQVNGDLYIADTDRENAINVGDTIRKNVISVGINNNVTFTSTGQKVFSPNVVIERVGSSAKLYLDTDGLIIGSGIHHIMLSGMMQIHTSSTSGGAFNISIYKNGSEYLLSMNSYRSTNTNYTKSISPRIVSVSEGDYFQFGLYAYNGDYANADNLRTYITAEVID